MKITDLLAEDKTTLSFEVFPPKTDDKYHTVEQAALEIAELEPDFMSVTYGAGGGTSRHTVNIASRIRKLTQVAPLAHLTCVTSTREDIRQMLDQLRTEGINNILALRGDIPKDSQFPQNGQYHYASNLVEEIKAYGGFCIGGACYPEGHPESPSRQADMYYLKKKTDSGCDFLTTQMFFDNNILYHYLFQLREHGITVPVFAGVMPVTNKNQIKRICELSGTSLPARFKSIVDKFGDKPAAMKQAGIAYATEQIIDLIANGVRGIHVYSMNKPEVARQIRANLTEIL